MLRELQGCIHLPMHTTGQCNRSKNRLHPFGGTGRWAHNVAAPACPGAGGRYGWLMPLNAATWALAAVTCAAGLAAGLSGLVGRHREAGAGGPTAAAKTE